MYEGVCLHVLTSELAAQNKSVIARNTSKYLKPLMRKQIADINIECKSLYYVKYYWNLYFAKTNKTRLYLSIPNTAECKFHL